VSAVANVAINVDSRGAVGKLREVQNRTSSLDKAAQGLTRSLAGLATAFGATFALGKIINDVARLDTNLRRLGTVGGDVQGLSKALDQVGKNVDGIAGKAELAAASYQALSAGFTETAQNAKIVEAATKAAVGGLVDVTSVVEVTTKTLNAYSMSGDQAIKVTDSISKAIEYGQVQWSDYTSQLGRVASIAAVAGVSLDEVNAFIAAATKNGATAEVAFTGLGATLSTLLQPTESSQKAAKELGIAWNLSGLQAQGFDGLIEELGKKMGANQEAAVRLLGSQEAIRGAFSAASKNGQDYATILEGLSGAAGKTQSDFDAMKGSVENQIKALNTAFTALGVKLFEVFGPTLTDLVKGTTTAVTNAVNAFNALPDPVRKGATELVRLIAQLLLVKKALEGIIALRTAFVAAMVAKAGAIASTGTAAKTSASAFALYTANTKTLQAQAATATPALKGMLGVLRSLALIGVITVGVDVIVKGIGTLMQANAELAKLRGEQAAGGAAATFQGADRQTVLDAQKQARQRLQAIESERKQSRTLGARVQQAATGILGVLAPMVGLPSQEQMAAKPALLRAREQQARDILALPVPAAAKPPTAPTRPFKVGDVIDESTVAGGKVGSGGGGGAAAAKNDEAKRIQERISGLQQDVALNEKLRGIREKIAEADLAGDQALAVKLQGEERLVQLVDSYDRLKAKATPAERDALEAKLQSEALLEQQNVLTQLNKLDSDKTKAFEDQLRPLQEQRRLLEAQLNGRREEEELIIQIENATRGLAPAEAQRVENLIRGNAALEEQLNKVDAFKQVWEGVSSAVASTFSSAIDAAVDGTENLGEALQNLGADLLKTIGKMLIMYGIAQALGALGGGADNPQGILSFLARGFGFRANGGPVNANQPYIVGERGPELFMPSSSGMVLSNRDTSDKLEQQNAAMRGNQATRQQLIKQQNTMTTNRIREVERTSQAMLASPDPIDVRYESQVINNVEYVTAEQHRKGMAQAAERGRALTLDAIYNSPKVRRKAGF
jgi:TP901 family phage tail tape measure protein